MRVQEIKEIDGYKYQFNPIMPTDAIKLVVRIMKVVGMSVGSGTDKNTSSTTVATALFERLDETLILAIIKDTLKGVIFLKPEDPDGDVQLIKPAVVDCFDAHFSQFSLIHIFNVVKSSLEVNFSDFFSESGALGGVMAKFKAKFTENMAKSSS